MVPLSARATEEMPAAATAIIAINAAPNPAERIFLPLRLAGLEDPSRR
jgi:hypothetical protein